MTAALIVALAAIASIIASGIDPDILIAVFGLSLPVVAVFAALIFAGTRNHNHEGEEV